MNATANPYLSGNFAPVDDELTALDLDVTGQIPRELNGRLLRIGPNPVAPEPKSYHWFIGNGMVHGLRLRDGQAEWYRRRYVRDDQVVAKRGGPPVAGPTHGGNGGGVVNTNVIGHAGRTFALVEAGNVPVELDYELETLTRTDFGGTLPGGFTAHPKRDPETGELHACVYHFGWDYIQYVVVGVDGRVRKTVDVPLPGKPMIHDCSITENWFVFVDCPVIFDETVIAEGYSLPYRWHPERPTRVGLLPRDGGADDVVYAEVEPCFVFHPLNSYEDDDGRIVLDVVRHPKMFDTDLRGPNEGPPTLDRWLIDPRGGPVKETRIDDHGQEFPRIDERLIGKPHRFGYGAGFGDGRDLVTGGLLKHDLQRGETLLRHEGAHRQFMEAVFVPRSKGAEEDDGWVMAYAHDAREGRADVQILDARDFTGEPVATVHLPDRVPFGFHCNWVPDEA
ncbi:MAG: carotenoid oxygenase family protein [Myxococcota bacterium]|nr:carotenoid oxygenase family protein [Myxococcota bacterium]